MQCECPMTKCGKKYKHYEVDPKKMVCPVCGKDLKDSKDHKVFDNNGNLVGSV